MWKYNIRTLHYSPFLVKEEGDIHRKIEHPSKPQAVQPNGGRREISYQNDPWKQLYLRAWNKWSDYFRPCYNSKLLKSTVLKLQYENLVFVSISCWEKNKKTPPYHRPTGWIHACRGLRPKNRNQFLSKTISVYLIINYRNSIFSLYSSGFSGG